MSWKHKPCTYRLALKTGRKLRCFTLISCPIVSCTNFVLCVPLCWVSNSAKLKAQHCYHIVTRAWHPFARIVIANGVLPRSEFQKSQKIAICRLLCALSNTQRNIYSPSNAMQYCSKIISILLIVCKLQQWEKKN